MHGRAVPSVERARSLSPAERCLGKSASADVAGDGAAWRQAQTVKEMVADLAELAGTAAAPVWDCLPIQSISTEPCPHPHTGAPSVEVHVDGVAYYFSWDDALELLPKQLENASLAGTNGRPSRGAAGGASSSAAPPTGPTALALAPAPPAAADGGAASSVAPPALTLAQAPPVTADDDVAGWPVPTESGGVKLHMSRRSSTFYKCV